MKHRFSILMMLLSALTLLCSCAPSAADEPPDASTAPAITSATLLPDSPELPTPSPEPSEPSTALTSPPKIPEGERKELYPPYFAKLEPYTGGSYTDGMNTFIFKDDGTVLCNLSYVYPGELTLEKKEYSKDSRYEITHSGEYEKIKEIAAELGYYEPSFDFAHKDGDTYYLTIRPMGGGSGEAYQSAEQARLLRISADGELLDYGITGVAHAVVYGGYIYYVDLIDEVYGSPGIGKIVRMDMDGKGRKTILNEPVFGTFQIEGDRIFYSDLSDGKAYSIDLSGGDKKPVGDRIAPERHRIGLEFYDDIIISKYWQRRGYSFGIFCMPGYDASPAIMDKRGENLVLFPPELCGEDPYEVINWVRFGDEHYSDSYLFLKSNYDGSYWVYYKGGFEDLFASIYAYAYEQYIEKTGS